MFKKGQSGNPGGKPKGAGEHTLRDLRKAVLETLHQLDASAGSKGKPGNWLLKFAKKNDANGRAYLQLLARCMPTRLEGPDGEPLVLFRDYTGRKEPEVFDATPAPSVDRDDGTPMVTLRDSTQLN